MSINFPDEAERCADLIDHACHITDMHNQRSVEAARGKSAPEQVRRADGSWPVTECIDCTEELNAARLLMGRVRCIACQTAKEKLEARHGRG